MPILGIIMLILTEIRSKDLLLYSEESYRYRYLERQWLQIGECALVYKSTRKDMEKESGGSTVKSKI